MFHGYPSRTNLLLANLSSAGFQRLFPYLKYILLNPGQILYETGEAIREVYFPIQATISFECRENSSACEVGFVGNEGMVGLPVILGGYSSTSRAIVQIAGAATQLNSEVLRGEFSQGGELHRLLLLYTQAQLAQVSQFVVCKTYHRVLNQLARWLLTAQDCVLKNELDITHQCISRMLGVRRASITEAALTLQESGIIHCKRGQITIINRVALESVACNCYGIVKSEYNRLLASISETTDFKT